MTESAHRTRRNVRPLPGVRKEQGTRWKMLILTGVLGMYLALFGMLPGADASRQAAQKTALGANDGNNREIVRAPQVILVTPPLTPLVIPADMQGTASQPAAVTVGGGTGQQAVQAGPAPVQVAPLPTIAPLPQVAMPVVRSRGS